MTDPESTDPAVVRSIAVTDADALAALELNETTSRRAVLRITPPFSARMRARIHVECGGYGDSEDGPEPIHVDPRDLFTAIPTYPRPAETEDALRAGENEPVSVERHYEHHLETVAKWRARLAESFADTVPIDIPGGQRHVILHILHASGR